MRREDWSIPWPPAVAYTALVTISATLSAHPLPPAPLFCMVNLLLPLYYLICDPGAWQVRVEYSRAFCTHILRRPSTVLLHLPAHSALSFSDILCPALLRSALLCSAPPCHTLPYPALLCPARHCWLCFCALPCLLARYLQPTTATVLILW